jgi:hypothetical protein
MVILTWGIRSSELAPRHLEIPSFVPWLAGIAVVVKAVAAAASLYALQRHGLVERRVLAKLAIGWLLLALVLFGLLIVFVRDAGLAILPLPHGLLSAPSIAALVILFLPLTRLALAPLALAWNRHR